MLRILRKLIPDNVSVFIDDVAIRGPMSRYEDVDHEDYPGVRRFVFEHVQILRKVFEAIYAAELTFSGKKVRFGMPGIEVVGFVCDADGRHPDASKVEKIANWPRPTDLTKLRGFLGLVVYYRIFIPRLAIIAAPLYALTQKGAPFIWTNKQESSFEELKAFLSSDGVVKTLDSPDLTGPPILTFDACTSIGWATRLSGLYWRLSTMHLMRRAAMYHIPLGDAHDAAGCDESHYPHSWAFPATGPRQHHTYPPTSASHARCWQVGFYVKCIAD